MSNDADLEYGPTPPEAQYEHTDVEPGVAYRFALWLSVAMLLSGGLVYGTYAVLERGRAANDRETETYPLAVGQSHEPPAPRLQTQPFKDVYQLKNDQRGALNSYGWVDKANGVVHIPVDRAMQLRLQRGMPARPDGSAGPTMVIEDSSSGRTAAAR
jgi:hypothetical protein